MITSRFVIVLFLAMSVSLGQSGVGDSFRVSGVSSSTEASNLTVTDKEARCETVVPPIQGLAGGVRFSVRSMVDEARAMVLEPDGKIILAGESDGGFALLRYASDGALDSGFGDLGKVVTYIGSDRGVGELANGVALQPEGKILVVGSSWGGVSRKFTLLRYNGDGGLDLSFGSGGKIATDFDGRWASALAVQPDGHIVAAGMSFASLARYEPNGQADASFGFKGEMIDGVGEYAHAVAVQGDGKIVVAGTASYNRGINREVALARYNSDGSRDKSFGKDGQVRARIGSIDSADGLVIQTDGGIVVSGVSYRSRSLRLFLVRYRPDGSLDQSFGRAGIVTATMADQVQDFAASSFSGRFYGGLAIQRDGKIVTAGFKGYSARLTNQGLLAARYNPNGTPDLGFGQAGQVTTRVGAYGDYARAVALQSDGKIVVAGSCHNARHSNFALVRYNPNGSLDSSFGIGGKVITRIGSGIIHQ